jgi:hypothetical protein
MRENDEMVDHVVHQNISVPTRLVMKVVVARNFELCLVSFRDASAAS